MNSHHILSKGAICLILLFLLSLNNIYAQEGRWIIGKIVNAEGLGIPNAHISIAGTNYNTFSDFNGNYKLSHLPPGHYTLILSSAEYRKISKNIDLKTYISQTVNITLKSNNTLKTVVIDGNKNPYSTEKSISVAKMPLKKLDNPQSYISIPETLFKTQSITNYREIFKNSPGMVVPVEASNGRLDLSSRGFSIRSNTKDGVSSLSYTSIDPANIKQVEILKGPSATLFGTQQSGYGGLVNIVTKKPYNFFGGSFGYSSGSHGLNRAVLDINTPLNKSKNVLLRLNASAEHKDSYKDAGFKKSIFIAPDLLWKINSVLTLELQGEYYNQNSTSPFFFAPNLSTSINDVRDLNLDFDKSFNPHEVNYYGKQANLHMTLFENLSPQWSGRTDVVYTHNSITGNRLSFKGVSDSTMTRRVNALPSRNNTVEVQQNFNHLAHFGKFENKLLLGLDFYHHKGESKYANTVVDTVNFINPGAQYYELTNVKIDHTDLGDFDALNKSYQNTYAAYASDVLTFNKRLSAMASLRVDRFENKSEQPDGSITGKYGQTALSTKLGIVYHPIVDRLAVFGNYMSGFKNVNGQNFEGRTFKPQSAEQYEAGVKLNLLQGHLNGRLSFYNIHVTNILIDDPDHLNYSIQDGSELSRGAEFRLTANPFDGFNLVAGYAYNHFKYEKVSPVLNGRRDYHSGPEHTFNFWMNYKQPQGLLEGLGIGFGGNYGSRQEEIKSFNAHSFYRPAFTVFDASIFYQHDFYRLSVKVNNLTDKTYWNNRLGIQAPRSVVGQVQFDF